MKPILKLQDASKIYRQGGVKTVGIEAVNLEIYPHDFVAITGRSGCGKSTLLNILGCMDELTSGSYFFDGEDITRLKVKPARHYVTKKLVMYSKHSTWSMKLARLKTSVCRLVMRVCPNGKEMRLHMNCSHALAWPKKPTSDQ